MPVNQRIAVAEIPAVFIIDKDRSREIVIVFIGCMQILFIVLSTHNRVVDNIAQCIYIDPSDHICIHTAKLIKVHLDRRKRLCLHLL